MVISSLQNERIKAIRALADRKERRTAGLFMADGLANLLAAEAADWWPRQLVVAAEASPEVMAAVRRAEAAGAEVLVATDGVRGKLAGRDNAPPVIGVYPIREAPLPPDSRSLPRETSDRAGPAAGTWLALEGVRDPGNLGTIFRTADAVGVERIVLVGSCCDWTAPDCIQAGMGSVFAVPVTRVDLGEFVTLAAAWPGTVVGTHVNGSAGYREVPVRSPALVVMGSESLGLSDAAAAACHSLVRIPMRAGVESLNLAVATAVMLYRSG
jgi:RNA methyltransferase, TrmH family